MPRPPGDRADARTPGTLDIISHGLEALRWQVVSITGYEAINELFRFEAVIAAPREEVAHHTSPFDIHRELPMQDVRFSLGDDPPVEGEPHFSTRFAMIQAAHHAGFHQGAGHDDVRLRLELVPRAWLLTQRRNSRIFQDAYVHEIVSKVLYENGIRHAWNLDKSYPRRLYCTQYQETDYEFVTRLLAEEGILFFFEHWTGSFEGGEPAKVEQEQSDFERDLKTPLDVTQGIAQGGKGLAAMTGGIAKAAGSQEVEGLATMVDAGFGMVGDAAKALSGKDEAPAKAPGRGQAGPRGDGDVFTFIDSGGVYPMSRNHEAEMLRLTIEHTGGMLAAHSYRVEELHRSERIAPRRVEVRDYDFRRPLLLLKQNAGEGHALSHGDEHTEAASSAGEPLEQYEHHGEHETPDVDQETADIHLEQHRRDVTSYDGKSRTPFLRAGHWFELIDPERFEPEPLVVVRIHHELHSQAVSATAEVDAERETLVKACARAIHRASRNAELGEEQLRDAIREVLAAPPAGGIVYQNFFSCVPSQVPYRPARPPRVMRNVTESATVMGPVGQDMYTDRFGRVKVQFHWDREGQFNEHSSVWMRVAQPWAGTGYGFQFFPRVGMEVLVTFLGGDPDRPVVIGSLYNGTHATPEPLPERLTRSGIRTQTSPKGGGFNELSFDDARGTERVYLHAQRDFDAVVNHSHGMKVKHAHTLEVGARQHVGVEGEQLVSVGGLQATTVGGDQTHCVAGSRRDRVVGNVAARVEGNALEQVRGTAVRVVDTDELTLVQGNRDLTIYGDSTVQVGGHEDDARQTLYVQGLAIVRAKGVFVEAEELIQLRTGSTYLAMDESGVTIEGDSVEIRGRDQADVIGDNVVLRTGQGALMRVRAGRAEVRGQEVALQSAESGGGGALDPQTHPPNVKLKLTHRSLVHGGDPIANTRYLVTTPMRPVEDLLSGTTNSDGELELHAPDFLDSFELTVWANESYPDIYPPEAGPLRFTVHLVDSLKAADDLPGARMRLRNLGYQPGTDLDAELDEATRQALRDFQLEAETPRSGELDDNTKRKLRELFGS